MRLFVNGIEVAVKNRLEILVDLADGGESLPPGASITVRGGPLQLHGRKGGPGLIISLEETAEIARDHNNPAILIEKYFKSKTAFATRRDFPPGSGDMVIWELPKP